jgi:nucleotide-binding universal stress UspA family protein
MIKARIAVGVDGSPGSLAAVRWAATEARSRDAELRVVVAHHLGRPGPGVVHEAVALARAHAPGVDVHGVARSGYAMPVLLHAAEEATLLVVGDRGANKMPGMPFGAVANQVATHARCSVVVIRGRADPGGGHVLAGVDDEPAADVVIGHAFEEAALHGAEVLAVTAGPDRRDAATGAATTDLDSRLDPWRQKYPAVTARCEYGYGSPAKVLVAGCAEARLAVVGPRRHGFEGVLLGAVGTRLLRHAGCPVLIAR